MAEDNNLFTDKTIDNQLFSVLEALADAGTYEPPSRDCFTDLTLDNQLYQILLAIEGISGGGGGGITSINGDTTAAQLIVGTAPLSASTAAGTTTISSTQASGATDGYLSSTDWTTFNNKVGSVTATAPITSSGGTTPDISTSIATNKIVGRSTAGTGVMEELTPVGITVSAGNITGIGGTVGTVDNAVPRADSTGGYTVQGSDIIIDDATTSTQANVAIRNAHSETDSALVLTPKGTGAFILGPKPDGTATGGNARGTRAVDLQTLRAVATQVASNSYSVISGGQNNTSSGTQSVVCGGSGNTASGTRSSVCGGESVTASGFGSYIGGGASNSASASVACVGGGRSNQASAEGAVIAGGGSQTLSLGNTASATYSGILGGFAGLADRYGQQSHANGRFAANGDAQRARFVMRNKTTTNAAVELFLDGSSTRLTIPSGKVLGLTINITGIKSDGSAVAHYLRQYCLKHISGTTSEVYAPVTIGSDNAAGTSIALSADDTNDALKVEVTGIAAETWRWVASVDAVEITAGA
jgi:hypothetical protein